MLLTGFAALAQPGGFPDPDDPPIDPDPGTPPSALGFEAFKVDSLGRVLSSIEKQTLWSDLLVNTPASIFSAPPCMDGQYYVAFQLLYDLGDKNTTVNWNAHLDIALRRGSTVLWTKPIEVQMINQNFISTIFHEFAVECGDDASGNNYNYVITTRTATGTVPVSNIYLKVLLFKVHEDNFNPSFQPIVNCSNSAGQTSLGWTYSGNSASEFDVEWLFIASYENYTGTVEEMFAKKGGAGISTKAASYDHQTFYPSGTIYYRVRAVGYKNLYPEHRILGAWGYSSPITFTNQQSDMSWQMQSVFSEDGKFKTSVSYYDPTMRQRQTQVNLSTNQTTIVGESMYDFEGRPSVSIMPVPVSGKQLTYKNNFNNFSSQDPTVGANISGIRKKFNYDNGSLLNSTIGSTDGAGKYYSELNSLNGPMKDYIPKSNGYVFSQTEYMRDSKSYVAKQSGVGEVFKMDGTHTTRTYYAQASPAELIRLFGSNVGKANHYKKHLVVDNNGQANISYLDQEGRTIATSLAGTPPGNVDQLPSYVSLPNTPVTVDITSKNRVENGRTVTVHKILNEVPNTNYTIDWNLFAKPSNLAEFGCPSCTYDLIITLTDPDGNFVDISGAPLNQSGDNISYQRKGITAADCNNSTVVAANIPALLTTVGDYTLTKILSSTPLNYKQMELIVTENTVTQTMIEDISDSYTVNPAECETCIALPACPEADKQIDKAIEEITNLDCQNILNQIVQGWRDLHSGAEPSQTDIQSDPLYCKYLLCGPNTPSDFFEKQLARIPNWTAAVYAGYDKNLVDKDPFFNEAALAGYNYKATMLDKLSDLFSLSFPYDNTGDLVADGTRTFTGSLEQVTDPDNLDYYIDGNGVLNTRGGHFLYFNLMANRPQHGLDDLNGSDYAGNMAKYKAQLDQVHWTMYRNYYLQAKRKVKALIPAYSSCTSALVELTQVDNLPTTTTGIEQFAMNNGYISPSVTPQEVNGAIWAITNKCGVTLSAGDRATIASKLTNYFSSYYYNYLRLFFIDTNVDAGVNQYLNDVSSLMLTNYSCDITPLFTTNPFIFHNFNPRDRKIVIPAGNLVYNATIDPIDPTCKSENPRKERDINGSCYPGWSVLSGTPNTDEANELYLWSAACNSLSEAIRGSFVAPLQVNSKYFFCFEYQVEDASVGVDNIRIELSNDDLFEPVLGSGSCGNPNYKPHATNPAGVYLAGMSSNSTAIWEQGYSNNTAYKQVCIEFTLLSPAKYFFVSTSTNSFAAKGVRFRNFLLQKSTLTPGSIVPVAVNVETPADYKYTVDWNAVRTTCLARAESEKEYLISYAKEKLVQGRVNLFYGKYNCLSNTTETMDYIYTPKEHHYTLYYYDQAGNLVQTTPPSGVNPLTPTQVQSFPGSGNPVHNLLTNYQYNSYNQMVSQTTPDAGKSDYIYDKKAQLRFSRNAQQALDLKYSYSKYDPMGRIIEIGELTKATILSDSVESAVFPNQSFNTLSDITWTYYDRPDITIQSKFWQRNLRNRISYVESTDQQNLRGNANNLKTYFSYDIHGNVRSVRQQVPGLSPKRVDYIYDLVSNKVNYVFFQFGKYDQLAHRYTYDADNRIIAVYTSTDRFLWNKEARYSYYTHGPVARVELGSHRVQGEDYYYTLQGWMKGMNMPFDGDPGADGAGTSVVGKDVASFALGYYSTDYIPSFASNVPADSRDKLWQRYPSQYGAGLDGYYNGNIAWMTTDLLKQGDLQSDGTKGMQAVMYKYDQLHRITKASALTSFNSSTGFATRAVSPAAYDELFTYDPNGNLLTLKRYDQAAALKDNFTYTYYGGTNRLAQLNINTDLTISSGTVTSNSIIYSNIIVTGSATFAPNSTVDLKALQSIKVSPTIAIPSGTNVKLRIAGSLEYDAIGNLTKNESDNMSVTWTPQGKVRQVTNNTTATVTSFRYDAMGNRVEKKVVSGAVTKITRYTRDASGNVMSVYNDTTMMEQPIYGSSRVGQYIGGAQEGKEILGFRQYEMTNHLGNVLSVISDKVSMNSGVITATVLSTSDYYAFGSAKDARSWKDPSLNYRYGFNGKEMDASTEWGSTEYDYGFRIYNPSIGRFLSVDPLTKSYPWYTPYQFAGNMPIKFIDLDGLEPAEAGTYGGQGAKASKLDDKGVAIAGTENQRWTWSNDAWGAVDFNVTNSELTSIFDNGIAASLKEIEIQVNLNGATYGISSERSLAHFLSQAGHEVGEFSSGLGVEESLNYSVEALANTFSKYFYSGTAVAGKYNADDYGRKEGQVANQSGIANIAYGNRMGNGDIASGDGYNYRGRGIFQLTGKANYSAFNTFVNQTGVDFVANPSLITTSTEYSIKSAMWFYKVYVVDKLTIETATVKEVTKKVNGGSNGLTERTAIFDKALEKLD